MRILAAAIILFIGITGALAVFAAASTVSSASGGTGFSSTGVSSSVVHSAMQRPFVMSH